MLRLFGIYDIITPTYDGVPACVQSRKLDQENGATDYSDLLCVRWFCRDKSEQAAGGTTRLTQVGQFRQQLRRSHNEITISSIRANSQEH